MVAIARNKSKPMKDNIFYFTIHTAKKFLLFYSKKYTCLKGVFGKRQ